MKFKYVISFAVAVLSPVAALAAPANNCSLTAPPVDSSATETDGAYLFFYPKKLERSYSGCQIMWNEKGQRLITTFFVNGELKKYEFTNPDDGVERGVCIYDRKSLAKGNAEECPEYDALVDGFRSVKDEASFLVPEGRDPRKR